MLKKANSLSIYIIGQLECKRRKSTEHNNTLWLVIQLLSWLLCAQRCEMRQNPVSRRSQPPGHWHQRCFHRNEHTLARGRTDTVPRHARLPGRWHAWSWPGSDRDQMWRWNGATFCLLSVTYSKKIKVWLLFRLCKTSSVLWDFARIVDKKC